MARSTDRSASAVVVFAWIGGFIVNTAYRSAWKSAHDVSSLSEATVIGMGSEALDILAFSLALVLVTRLYQMQHSVATLSARHDDEAASVSASKTKTQWRAAEIFLFGFVGAASLVVILLYATWPTQPRRVNIAAASKPSGSPQNALPHREPTPEEKAVLKWNDQRSAHPLSPINSQASHSVVYLANRHGDFVLNANVNGTPTKFIL